MSAPGACSRCEHWIAAATEARVDVARLGRVEKAARAALAGLRDSEDPSGAAPVIACSNAATILAEALAVGGEP